MKRVHECACPGCHNLTSEKYCEEHKKQFENRGTTSQWAWMYKTKWWVHNRKDFLMKHPFCEICGKPSTTIHHDPEHNGNMTMFKDKSTWKAICGSCHSKIHMSRLNERKKEQ